MLSLPPIFVIADTFDGLPVLSLRGAKRRGNLTRDSGEYFSLQGKGAVFRVRPYSPAPPYPENSSYPPAPLFFKGDYSSVLI